MPQITNPPAGGKSCELSPFRHQRLRRDAPRHEFRDLLVPSSEVCSVTVDTIRGARPLASLVADGDWP
jgi:hypothetical protein